MRVPGSNLLSLAFGVIGQQSVEWRRYAGQETLADGTVRTRWANPVTLLGSLQPADSRLLQQLGLDWTKDYVVFRGSADFTDVDRDQTGDKLTYDDKTYQIVGRTDWYAQDGWQAVVAVRLKGPERARPHLVQPTVIASTSRVPSPRVIAEAPPLQIVRPQAIASTSRVPSPTVRRASEGQTIRPPAIASTARVPAPTARPGRVSIRPEAIGPGIVVPHPTVRPGLVRLRPVVIPSAARVPTPDVAPGLWAIRPPAIASTSRVPAPSVQVPVPWYDAPEYARLTAIVDAGRAAIWTGDPEVNGRFPKRVAAPEEIFTVVGPAGRSYIPQGGLPYRVDTPANTVRFDHYRGRPQMAVEPAPRFDRMFPSENWTTAQNLLLLQWNYVFGMFAPVGEYVTFEGASITGGTWRLDGAGANTWVWGIIPHPTEGQVQITPHGSNIRYAMLDTRGTADTPNYPTNWIPTTTERVDRAGEDVRVSAAVLAQMIAPVTGVRRGTIITRGQFYAPHDPAAGGGAQARIALGWTYGGYIGVQANGNLFTSGGYGPELTATPALASNGGDPFQFCFSFRDRDLSEENPGVRRMAINGGVAVEQIGRYNGGPGEMDIMTIARAQNGVSTLDVGAGGYDFWGFSPDLMTTAQVEAWAQYPGFVAGHSPTRGGS